MPMKLYATPSYREEPADIGIPKAGFVFNGSPGWANWDGAALRESLKAIKPGSLITMNCENDAPTSFSAEFPDEVNRNAIKMVARRAEWVHAARPDCVLDWNTSPQCLRFDPWRYPLEGARIMPTLLRLNDMIYSEAIPHFNTLSSQGYYARFSDNLMDNYVVADIHSNYYPGWIGRIRRIHDGLTPFGLPVNIMFERGYSYGTVDEKKYRGKWIAGIELETCINILAAFGHPVILWNATLPDNVDYSNSLPEWPYRWSVAAANHPSHLRWVAAQK